VISNKYVLIFLVAIVSDALIQW